MRDGVTVAIPAADRAGGDIAMPTHGLRPSLIEIKATPAAND
jgi:hypothetical protein